MDSIPLLVLLKYGPDLLGYNMRNNYFVSGDWNIICDVCGWKIKASDTKHRWDGRITCRKCWEPRHDADFIKARKVDGSGGGGSVPWTQPDPPEVSVSPYDTYITSGSNGAEGFGNSVASGFQGNVSVVADGDHPAGDGLTRLQCLFAGGSTADVSSYAVGSGVEVSSTGANVVATDGLLTVKLSGAVNNYHAWSQNGMGHASGVPHTTEIFVKAEEFDPNPATGSAFFTELDMYNMNASRVAFNGFASSKNTLRAYATTWYNYSGTVDIFDASVLGGTFHHIAWVCNGVSNDNLRVYLDGVLLVTYPAATGLLAKVAPTLGEVKLGGVGAAFNQTNFYFTGVRVRHAEMYTGASFTPPTSPADWGPP